MRESFIEIIPVAEPGRVVTILEVLSPSNKEGGPGPELYLTKQREALGSRSHLLEIDLLRAGKPTVAVPPDLLAAHGPSDYRVCLTRATRPDRFEVWPFTVRDSPPPDRRPFGRRGFQMSSWTCRPSSPVVTTKGHSDAGSIMAAIPGQPLAPADGSWADALLRGRGLRD